LVYTLIQTRAYCY